MFVFKKKIEFESSVDYIWDVYLDDKRIGKQIGIAGVDIDNGRGTQDLVILLNRSLDISESVIKNIAEEFKYLANNYLLGINEDYEPFPYIAVSDGNETSIDDRKRY